MINTPFDANSFIKTLEEKYQLNALSARDQASPTLANLPVLPTPRTRSQMPRLRVRKLSAEEASSDGNLPPGDIAEGLVRMVHAIATGNDDLPAGVHSINDALQYLQQNTPP